MEHESVGFSFSEVSNRSTDLDGVFSEVLLQMKVETGGGGQAWNLADKSRVA